MANETEFDLTVRVKNVLMAIPPSRTRATDAVLMLMTGHRKATVEDALEVLERLGAIEITFANHRDGTRTRYLRRTWDADKLEEVLSK